MDEAWKEQVWLAWWSAKLCRWWPAAKSRGGWSLHHKVGTEFIVYMHVSASPLALTGATGASVALEGLGIREICFTYEQRRSAASPDSFPNQEVKHRRTVFKPERGGSGRSIGRDGIGEVGLLPHAQAQLGLHAWVQLATRWGSLSSLAFLVLLSSTNLLQDGALHNC